MFTKIQTRKTMVISRSVKIWYEREEMNEEFHCDITIVGGLL